MTNLRNQSVISSFYENSSDKFQYSNPSLPFDEKSYADKISEIDTIEIKIIENSDNEKGTETGDKIGDKSLTEIETKIEQENDDENENEDENISDNKNISIELLTQLSCLVSSYLGVLCCSLLQGGSTRMVRIEELEKKNPVFFAIERLSSNVYFMTFYSFVCFFYYLFVNLLFIYLHISLSMYLFISD